MDSGKLLDPEEQEATKELMGMSREELDKVPFELKKWQCQGKKCINGTFVRDYGISPYFFSPRKTQGGWWNLNLSFWMCGKHNKLRKRLEKSFNEDIVQFKIFDFSVMPTSKVIEF